VKRAALLSLLFPAAFATAQSPSFMAGVEAYDAGDHARCADTLLAVEAAGAPVATNGELLVVECLSRVGRFDEAFAYLRRQLPAGRIPFDELRDKSRPGLDALRGQPAWQAFLAEAAQADARRAARLDATLREELLKRAAYDQEARAIAFGGRQGDVNGELLQKLDDIDRSNTAWLERIVDEKGWPDSDLVGRDGANAAWMLVQHATHDPAFQERALGLMEAAMAKGTVARDDFALLTDRVLLARGKPQRYGTQFQTDGDGVMRLRPVEDEAGLDARRSAMGLPTMAEYRRMLADAYGRQVE